MILTITVLDPLVSLGSRFRSAMMRPKVLGNFQGVSL